MSEQFNPLAEPQYLGDSVYAQIADDGYHVLITTGSHKLAESSDQIYLDSEVSEALVNYINNARERAVDSPSPNPKPKATGGGS